MSVTIFASVGPSLTDQLETYQVAQRRSCKSVSTCREVVEMSYDGYAGADRDNDAIPCENLCKSKAEVERIRLRSTADERWRG